jgi:alpha-galactosidase
MTIITFIGAGSTVFTKNIAGDLLHRPALRDATIRLMDIDPRRLDESEVVVSKLARSMEINAKVETTQTSAAPLRGRTLMDSNGFLPTCVQDSSSRFSAPTSTCRRS